MVMAVLLELHIKEEHAEEQTVVEAVEEEGQRVGVEVRIAMEIPL